MNEKQKNQEFENFIGLKSVENDDGWSKEVWDAAWQAAIESMKDQSQ